MGAETYWRTVETKATPNQVSITVRIHYWSCTTPRFLVVSTNTNLYNHSQQVSYTKLSVYLVGVSWTCVGFKGINWTCEGYWWVGSLLSTAANEFSIRAESGRNIDPQYVEEHYTMVDHRRRGRLWTYHNRLFTCFHHDKIGYNNRTQYLQLRAISKGTQGITWKKWWSWILAAWWQRHPMQEQIFSATLSASPFITTSFSRLYGGISFKTQSRLIQQDLRRGEVVVVTTVGSLWRRNIYEREMVDIFHKNWVMEASGSGIVAAMSEYAEYFMRSCVSWACVFFPPCSF